MCKEKNGSIPVVTTVCPKGGEKGEQANGCYRWSAGCDANTCIGAIFCEQFDSVKGVWKKSESSKNCQSDLEEGMSNASVSSGYYSSSESSVCFSSSNSHSRKNLQYIQSLVSLTYILFLENPIGFDAYVKLITQRFENFDEIF